MFMDIYICVYKSNLIKTAIYESIYKSVYIEKLPAKFMNENVMSGNFCLYKCLCICIKPDCIETLRLSIWY